MRKSALLALLLAPVFMTAGMGLPIMEGGKLAVSNIAPFPFMALAGLCFFSAHESIDKRIGWFLLLFNLSCLASFAIFLLRYQWQPNFPVLLFEDVEIAFCLLLWWFGSASPDAFRTAVGIGIVASIPVSAMYGLHELNGGSLGFTAGMDDKSQGAVLLCCEAYVLIRFFGSRLGRLAGAGLYLSSFLTISRLPVFFLPAIFLGLMRRSRLGAITTLCAVGAAVYMLATAGDLVRNTFVVYNRLSSVQAVTGSDSTEAHLELLKAALDIKFTDPLAFAFGIGPDNFSKALSAIPASADRLEGLDPKLMAFAKRGMAPLHSTPMQILLDYNIVIFLLFVFYLARVFRFLILRRNMTDLTFACGLLLAASFYSLHNKPYFYLYVTTVALLIATELEPLASSADTEGAAAATDSPA